MTPEGEDNKLLTEAFRVCTGSRYQGMCHNEATVVLTKDPGTINLKDTKQKTLYMIGEDLDTYTSGTGTQSKWLLSLHTYH